MRYYALSDQILSVKDHFVPGRHYENVDCKQKQLEPECRVTVIYILKFLVWLWETRGSPPAVVRPNGSLYYNSLML